LTFLTAVHGPEGVKYTFKRTDGSPAYETGLGADCEATISYAGAMSRMVLPTKGETNWTWREWPLPQQVITPYPTKHFGVASRSVRDPYSNQSATWNYTNAIFYPPGWENTPSNQDIPFENRVTISDPHGYDWIHYFLLPARRFEDASAQFARSWQYGLPISKAIESDNYSLSQELKRNGARLRSWWLEFDRDAVDPDPMDGEDRNRWINSNRRVLRARTKYR
jgi:hypothetical protein